jgi:hypothetical protein
MSKNKNNTQGFLHSIVLSFRFVSKVPRSARSSFKRAWRKLNLTKDEVSGCKLALIEMSQKSQ